MKLQELLTTITPVSPISSPIASITEITGISTNSHACQPGDLFIGLPGTRRWRRILAFRFGNRAVAAIISPAGRS
jgi:UDP-N-acetylmuramoyl-L-alanyl-D-glutamate--2,6-diaminopimelate ligase